MTQLYDDPRTFAQTALRGFCDVYEDLVEPIPGGVLRSTAVSEGKVALVIGGGSGHYPAFAGYVGAGLADAAVAGDVFASPSTRQVFEVATCAHHGGGILLGFGNYAGDVLNFGAAAKRLRGNGIDVRVLPVTDDIASAGKDEANRRRGIAGDLPVFKVAGAAAEAGLSLDEVERLARYANARTRSFGVAFDGCTLPGAGEPLFRVPQGRIALGLGIHGEPGIGEMPRLPAAELAQLLVDRLLEQTPEGCGTRVATVLNGLGSTKQEELFVLWTSIAEALRARNLSVVAPLVGEFVTSLDMNGCSLTLTWLDDELERLWCAPCHCAALKVGTMCPTKRVARTEIAEGENRVWPPATVESQVEGSLIAAGFARLAEAFRSAEQELGRIDAQAGDGDHGLGMVRGAGAAAEAAHLAAQSGAGARSVLAAAADAWGDRAGGTSGALWSLGLRSGSAMLSDTAPMAPAEVAAAVRAGLDSVMECGGAQPGDKTLIDALAPLAEALTGAIQKNATMLEAWQRAADAAQSGADGTANLVPRIGRARPLAERSRGHRDAGAVSLALAAHTIFQFLQEQI